MSNIKDMIKGSVATVSVAALVVGGTVAYACTTEDSGTNTEQVVSTTTNRDAAEQDNTEPNEWGDCINKNFEAKVSYWKDILEGTKEGYVGVKLGDREDQIAADMENAAQNLRNGSYRVCWGE